MRLLIFLFLIFSFAPAWGEHIPLRDFSGGLNTKAGLYGVEANQCIEILNWDLSDEWAGMRARLGYISVTDSIKGNQNIKGLYAHVDTNGIKRLFSVIDTTKTLATSWNIRHGLGQLTVSDNFSYIIDPDSGANLLYHNIYMGEIPFWASWKNNCFLSNGRQLPIVWDNENKRATELVMPPPGAPLIIPINDTGYNGISPQGEFRYMV